MMRKSLGPRAKKEHRKYIGRRTTRKHLKAETIEYDGPTQLLSSERRSYLERLVHPQDSLYTRSLQTNHVLFAFGAVCCRVGSMCCIVVGSVRLFSLSFSWDASGLAPCRAFVLVP